MRIVTMCTLAFAICGDRVQKTSQTVPSKTSTNRRWLAKSLLLGASVHAASGFVRPPHPARGLGRPAGVRALEPLEESYLKGMQEWRPKAENYFKGGAGKIEDALVAKGRIEDVLFAAQVNHRLAGPDSPWEDWKPQWIVYLQDLDEKNLEELWLGVMAENAESDAEEGKVLLAKIDDETSFLSSKAEWKSLEDDVRVFQEWQERARERYATICYKFTTPAGVRALETLKGAMNDPLSSIHQAQRLVKAGKIFDILDAAELGQHFNVDGIPWEDYDIDRSPDAFRCPKLKEHLQSMKGKPLENLWLSVRSAFLKKRSRPLSLWSERDGRWRWLAKSLLLGTSVHAASGIVRFPGVRALEPLEERIEDELHAPWEEWRPKAKNYLKGGAGKIEDALVAAERIEDVLFAAELNHRLEGPANPWEEWKTQWASYLQDLDEKKLEELWLGVMVENANRDAELGHELLAKIDDETSFLSSKAEWKALEDHVRVFQKWQEYARERYATIYHKFTTPAGVRALEELKGATDGPLSILHQAQRLVKAGKILDILDAAEEFGQHFIVDGIPVEEYIDLKSHLQTMQGKPLEILWRSVRSEFLKKRSKPSRLWPERDLGMSS